MSAINQRPDNIHEETGQRWGVRSNPHDDLISRNDHAYGLSGLFCGGSRVQPWEIPKNEAWLRALAHFIKRGATDSWTGSCTVDPWYVDQNPEVPQAMFAAKDPVTIRVALKLFGYAATVEDAERLMPRIARWKEPERRRAERNLAAPMRRTSAGDTETLARIRELVSPSVQGWIDGAQGRLRDERASW